MYNLQEALENNKILEAKKILNIMNPVDIANLLEDLEHEDTLRTICSVKQARHERTNR